LSKRHRPNYFAFSVNHRTLRKAFPLADLSGVGSQIKERDYAGTDFIVARNGRIASVYLFFDELP